MVDGRDRRGLWGEWEGREVLVGQGVGVLAVGVTSEALFRGVDVAIRHTIHRLTPSTVTRPPSHAIPFFPSIRSILATGLIRHLPHLRHWPDTPLPLILPALVMLLLLL